jgi:hypothetical protein
MRDGRRDGPTDALRDGTDAMLDPPELGYGGLRDGTDGCAGHSLILPRACGPPLGLAPGRPRPLETTTVVADCGCRTCLDARQLL